MAKDGDRDRDTYWNTGLNSLGPNEKQREIVSKESRTRGNLHPTMDGDRDGDPHWSTGLSSQGPNEEKIVLKHKNRKKYQV